jgi:hypothetical protein
MSVGIIDRAFDQNPEMLSSTALPTGADAFRLPSEPNVAQLERICDQYNFNECPISDDYYQTKNFSLYYYGEGSVAGANFGIDSVSLSFSHDEEPEPPETPEKAAIFIDFSNLASDLKLVSTATFDGDFVTYWAPLNETDEIEVVISDPERLVSLVQEIFRESGINVDVITDNSNISEYDSVISALFRPGEKDKLGEAADVVPSSWELLTSDGSSIVVPYLLRVDQGDQRKDGTVTVFVDENDRTLEDIARVIAHEAGHGFGAFHTNGPGTSDVMDYEFDISGNTPERFMGQPLLTGSFVKNSAGEFDFRPFLAVTGVGTTNAQWHLRHYALGEPAEALASEGLIPGTYDTDLGGILSAFLLASDVFDSDVDWYLSVDDGFGDLGDGNFSIQLDQFVSAGSLYLAPLVGQTFSLMGRSKDSNFIDIVLGIEKYGDIITSFDSASIINSGAGFYQYMSILGDPEWVSDVEITHLGRFSLRADGVGVPVSPIPIPASLPLLASGLLGALWLNRRNRFRVAEPPVGTSVKRKRPNPRRDACSRAC